MGIFEENVSGFRGYCIPDRRTGFMYVKMGRKVLFFSFFPFFFTRPLEDPNKGQKRKKRGKKRQEGSCVQLRMRVREHRHS